MKSQWFFANFDGVGPCVFETNDDPVDVHGGDYLRVRKLTWLQAQVNPDTGQAKVRGEPYFVMRGNLTRDVMRVRRDHLSMIGNPSQKLIELAERHWSDIILPKKGVTPIHKLDGGRR